MNWRTLSVIVAVSAGVIPTVNLFAEENDFGMQFENLSIAIQSYCIDCHNPEEKSGNFSLEKFFTSVKHGDGHWDTTDWEKVLKRLKGRQMPPPDAIRPEEKIYQQMIASLENILDTHDELYPQPGATDSLRRLNRTEYRNAIRDLLDLEVNVDDLLPADELSHGFDNVTVGELSPALLSRYLSAAEKISRLAIGAKRQSPGGVTVRLPADRTQETHVQGLPLGTRGGTVFDYNFPADGEYEIQILLMRDRDEFVEGLKEPHELHFLLDKKLVDTFEVKPSKNKERWRRDDSQVDAHLQTRFSSNAGPHSVGVTFPQKFSTLQEIKREPFDANFNKHRHPRRSPAIFQISIVGPFNPKESSSTPTREKIFGSISYDDESQLETAKEILEPLARRAFRRPVTDADLEVALRFFKKTSKKEGFEAGIQSALAMILVNPHFLFRSEIEAENLHSGQSYFISDLELASRLSFFLWSSIPDEELLDLAASNHLHEPEVMQAQVERMLHDVKAKSLVENFATQWLYLKNLNNFRPDMRLFPGFDDNLRQAMQQETLLLFENMMHENRTVLDLLRSDTTYLNERLAKHYGIPNVIGSHFRPVKLSAGSHRGGLLRHASILSVTSYATRTSPTIRGNWILENILGTPAPPPPPNVPTLKDKTVAMSSSIRERLAEHRANPACASCHNLMDPLGFSLENFDAVGRWREFEAGKPINSSGALPDGNRIDSLDELEEGILSHPEMFVETLAAKLLTFALGRGIEFSDGPAIRKIVRQAATDEYQFEALIQAITASKPFRMREKL